MKKLTTAERRRSMARYVEKFASFDEDSENFDGDWDTDFLYGVAWEISRMVDEIESLTEQLAQVKARADDLINQRDNFSDKYQKALVETKKCQLKSSFYYWGLEAVKTIAITYPQDKAILKAVESAIDSAISAERSE